MATRATLGDIKKSVELQVGKRVILKANIGRKKFTQEEGVVTDTFSDVFLVKLNVGTETEKTVSYSYSDILIHDVELQLI
jgi:uncharacterized protein Veg